MFGAVSGISSGWSGRLRLAGCVLLAIITVGLMAVPHAAADTPFLPSVASSTLPAGALANEDAETLATACDATDACVAVGVYEDSSTTDDAMVMAITDGFPGKEIEVTLPANADQSLHDSELYGVSCQSDASCTAIGYYAGPGGYSDPMVVQITNGVPSAAVEINLPANAETSYDDHLEGVSCPASGACEVVGEYSITGGSYEGLVVPITGGVPGTAAQVALPSNFDTSEPDGELEGVACQSAASCTAVGYYNGPGLVDLPLAVMIDNGVPASPVETEVPQNDDGSPDGADTDVACPASGACETIGFYYDSSDTEQLMVEPITGGSPGAATKIPVPKNTSAIDIYLDGMSCSSASLCEASGYYEDSSELAQGVVVLLNGPGSSATEIAPPSGADLSNGQVADLSAVACVPSGPCLSDGLYAVGSDEYAPLQVQTSASGSLAAAVALPGPSTASTSDPDTIFQGVGCDSAGGSCVAVGLSADATDDFEPYVESEQAPLSMAAASLPAAAVGVSYQAQLAATGAWGVYAWSVTAGALPAGLSLNTQTGAITGSPTAGGTFAFTVGVAGTGSPMQTASQSLSLTVAAAQVSVAVPHLTIVGGSGLVSHKRLGVKLACSGAACRGTVKVEGSVVVTIKHVRKRVRKHRTVVFGTAGYTAAAGQTEPLSLGLNAAGRRALANAKKHHLAVTIAASVSGGTTASLRETIRSASKPKKKKKM
jgi:hypothetical protein